MGNHNFPPDLLTSVSMQVISSHSMLSDAPGGIFGEILSTEEEQNHIAILDKHL